MTTTYHKYRFAPTFRPNQPNVIKHTFDLMGTTKQLANNVQCSIHAVIDSNGNIGALYFVEFDKTMNKFVQNLLTIDLAQLALLNLGLSTVLQIGTNCKRVAVNNHHVFRRVNITLWTLVSNDWTQFTWTSMD